MPADPLTYTTFLLSHMRLTHTSTRKKIIPFPISIRNSAAAVAHLLTLTKTWYLWVGDGPVKILADEVLTHTKDNPPTTLSFPSFARLYNNDPPLTPEQPLYQESVSLDSHAVILHSSG